MKGATVRTFNGEKFLSSSKTLSLKRLTILEKLKELMTMKWKFQHKEFRICTLLLQSQILITVLFALIVTQKLKTQFLPILTQTVHDIVVSGNCSIMLRFSDCTTEVKVNFLINVCHHHVTCILYLIVLFQRKSLKTLMALLKAKPYSTLLRK